MSEPTKKSRAWMRIAALTFAMLSFAMMAAIGSASASVISDIPNQLNDALLDGASLFAAKAILTAAIMVSVGLLLAVLKMPVMGIFIVLLTTLAALTAIGWADISILILVAFIIVFMFGKTVIPALTGSQGGGG